MLETRRNLPIIMSTTLPQQDTSTSTVHQTQPALSIIINTAPINSPNPVASKINVGKAAVFAGKFGCTIITKPQSLSLAFLHFYIFGKPIEAEKSMAARTTQLIEQVMVRYIIIIIIK
jgi:hypothetical protein